MESKVTIYRDKVWAVKWYRGNFEIFRFIADETPPTKVFKLDNFDVDVRNFIPFSRQNQIFEIFSRACCLMARHCFSGMSISIIPEAIVVKLWQIQLF